MELVPGVFGGNLGGRGGRTTLSVGVCTSAVERGGRGGTDCCTCDGLGRGGGRTVMGFSLSYGGKSPPLMGASLSYGG